jgi:hypothetical protein
VSDLRRHRPGGRTALWLNGAVLGSSVSLTAFAPRSISAAMCGARSRGVDNRACVATRRSAIQPTEPLKSALRHALAERG